MEGVSTPITAFSSTPLNMTSFANSPQRSTDYRLRYRGNTSTMNRLPAILPAPSGSAQIRNQFNPIRPQNPNQANFMTTPQRMPLMAPPMSTIKPILPQNRSIVEKVVDYMIKDGPENRFALICNHCYSHNGMALKEEFEFISYICCYCKRFNPSRKTRPMAPQLKPLDKSKRNSLSPLIDEPESDTDSERGRISSDCTRIEEISSNQETDNQNKDSNQNKDKTSTDPTEDTTDPTEDTAVPTEEGTEKTIENETNESESKETTETDEKEDKNEAEIPFIDDSSL